jgi:hypothetical protein
MSDYVSKNYMEQGGDRWVIGEGGELVIEGAVLGARPVPSYFVDTFYGSVEGDGKAWSAPFTPLASALAAAATGANIFVRGDIREEAIGSNLKFDINIIGVGSKHHPDLPAAGYDPGSTCWRPPVSPTAATPLLKLRGRGWNFYNIMFDCPVDHAAVKLERNAAAGLAEYDSSHAGFHNCLFRQGKWGIYDESGTHNIVIDGCEFFIMSEAAIKFGNVAVIALPLKWTIKNNIFPANGAAGGNASHIISPMSSSLIKDNVFGTVTSTAKYVDLTGGSGNVVTKNTLGGVYDTDDYVGGTGDMWLQNAVAVKAVTAPDGLTLAAPAAP